MINNLTFQESKDTWYPASISSLEDHLGILIQPNDYFQKNEIKPLRKNIAYNLQYVEFIDRLLNDLKLSSVLRKQNIKSFVVYSSSIIEALFYYLVLQSGYGATTEWQFYKKIKSNQYEIKGEKFINETEILIKISPSVTREMTFDQMCKKVESKKLLGEVGDLYKEISQIRKLRNKIHIHGIEHSTDTDYWNFSGSEFKLIRKVLYGILTSPLFQNSSYRAVFDYLK